MDPREKQKWLLNLEEMDRNRFDLGGELDPLSLHPEGPEPPEDLAAPAPPVAYDGPASAGRTKQTARHSPQLRDVPPAPTMPSEQDAPDWKQYLIGKYNLDRGGIDEARESGNTKRMVADVAEGLSSAFLDSREKGYAKVAGWGQTSDGKMVSNKSEALNLDSLRKDADRGESQAHNDYNAAADVEKINRDDQRQAMGTAQTEKQRLYQHLMEKYKIEENARMRTEESNQRDRHHAENISERRERHASMSGGSAKPIIKRTSDGRLVQIKFDAEGNPVQVPVDETTLAQVAADVGDAKNAVKDRDNLSNAKASQTTANALFDESLANYTKASKQGKTGPVAGRLSGVMGEFGFSQGDARDALDIDLGNLLADRIREVSGTAASVKEADRLKSLLPNPNMDPQKYANATAASKRYFQRLVDKYVNKVGLDTDLPVEEGPTPAPTQQGGGGQEPDVASYAQRHGISYEQALMVKQKRMNGG